VLWLTGCTVLYNERSQITFMKLPFKYSKRFFECGMYGKYLNTVQQESTFWSSSLHRLIDFDVLSRLDAYLTELTALSRKPEIHEYALAFIDKLISLAPSKVKKSLNRKNLFRYDHLRQEWF
jgi:hypothetical protein